MNKIFDMAISSMCENGMNAEVPLGSKSNLQPHPENNTLVPFRALLQNM